MDRESFDVSVEASGADWPRIAIDATSAASDLADRLVGPDGTELSAETVDVTYRETGGDRPGVLALSNRLTGEFLLEVPLESDRVSTLVEAVLENDGDDGHYRLTVTTGDATNDDGTTRYDMETLLVYDADGNLLRARSLIPGGVEL